MATTLDDSEVDAVDNSKIRNHVTSDTRDGLSVSVLRNITALYASLPSRSRDDELETVRSVELSTTPHSINDILARSTRPPSPMPLSLQSNVDRTLLPAAFQTKRPLVRLASPVGLAVRAVASSGSPSLYWAAAAAAASLMSPSLCWNQPGTSQAILC